jgi:hypothetical protein
MASRLHDLSIDGEEQLIPLVATNRAQKARHGHNHDVDDNQDEEEEEDADWAELSALEEELALENHAYPARSSQDIESNDKRRAYNHKAPNEDDDEDQDATDPALQMVKAVVKETDDPSLPNITFRVLFLGTILCAVGAAISQLFFVCEFER